MNDLISWLPFIGLVIVYAVDKILDRLRDRGIDLNKMSRQVDDLSKIDFVTMSRQVGDSYAWHSKTDEDGVKVWYVRRSLEGAIRDLSQNIQAQTKLLEGFMGQIREMGKKIDHLEKAATETSGCPVEKGK